MSDILPVPKSDAEVATQVPVAVGELGLALKDIQGAADELGLVKFTPERLMASHKAGEAMKKVGVLRIGRTWLFRAHELAETGAEQCDNIMHEKMEPETKASILQSKLGFTKQITEVASQFIRSAELDSDEGEKRPQVKPFAPGAQAGPVVYAEKAVVNTQVNQTK